MQHGHKSPRKFLVARGQSPELFDTIEKSLHKVAIFVNMLIVFSPNNAVFSARDDCLCISRHNADDKRVGVVSLVSHNRQGIKSINQGLGLRYVRSFATSQKQTNGISQSIHCCMNLCRQSATRTSDILRPFFFWAPAACWWARTMVLSMKSISKSGSPDTASANRAQVPLSHHRANRTYALCQFPNSFGRSRQGEPVRAIQSTASKNSLLSLAVTPRSCFFPSQSGSNRAHWSSRKSNRSMPLSPLGDRIERSQAISKLLIVNRP